MPNWCDNHLKIEGDTTLLSKLATQVQVKNSDNKDDNTDFSCQKIKPRPKSKENEWYDWNIKNWGSKWDCSEVYSNAELFTDIKPADKSQSLEYGFLTAWSPILPVIVKLSRQYKELTFSYRYHEGGSNFFGFHEIRNGKEIYANVGELSEATCDELEILMGSEHHYCSECNIPIDCNDRDEVENNSELCSECRSNNDEEEKTLWNESRNEKINA